jgi:predicted lactoylglutathione lyase
MMLMIPGVYQPHGTGGQTVDANFTPSTEALVALSAKSREEVNRIVETALAAGAKRYAEPKDHGFMYQWGFEDLDGHIWEYLWMAPAHI